MLLFVVIPHYFKFFVTEVSLSLELISIIADIANCFFSVSEELASLRPSDITAYIPNPLNFSLPLELAEIIAKIQIISVSLHVHKAPIFLEPDTYEINFYLSLHSYLQNWQK